MFIRLNIISTALGFATHRLIDTGQRFNPFDGQRLGNDRMLFGEHQHADTIGMNENQCIIVRFVVHIRTIVFCVISFDHTGILHTFRHRH